MSLSNRTRGFTSRAVLVIAAIAALAFVLALPCMQPDQAFAKESREYDIRQVDISAWVLEDGTLDVWEERRFDFDGKFNGVYWDISEAGSEFGDAAYLPEKQPGRGILQSH